MSTHPENDTEQQNRCEKNAPTENKALPMDQSVIDNTHGDDMPSTSGCHGVTMETGAVFNSSHLEDAESVPMDEDPPVDHVVVNQCLSEPLLCRECSQGTVPPLLVKVYNECNITNEQEAVIVALHILMLESGYIPVHVCICQRFILHTMRYFLASHINTYKVDELYW